jgi:hypothetical protein
MDFLNHKDKNDKTFIKNLPLHTVQQPRGVQTYSCFPFYSIAIPIKASTGPSGSSRFRLPEFLANQHIKVVRLSAPCTGHLYLPGDTPSICFL